MFVGAASKNQKLIKQHKRHVQAILNEVKVKSNIEGIQEKENFFSTYRELFPKKKKFNHFKHWSTENYNERVEEKKKREVKPQIQKNQKNFRVSKKLEEIAQYIQKFPTHKSTRCSEKKNIQQFINLIENRQRSNSVLGAQRRKGIFKNNQQKDVREDKKLNHELFLDFKILNRKKTIQFIESLEVSEKQNQNHRKIKQIIQQSKQNLQRQNDFTMKHFIEQRIKNKCRTRKKERKTHEIQTTKNENWKENYSFIEDKDKNIDVRNENVRKIHKFIRGGQQQEKQEFSNYVSLSQIEKNCQNFKIYESMIGKIKNSIKRQKINPRILSRQTVRNVLYLNESLKKELNMEKKKQIKMTMKKLKITL